MSSHIPALMNTYARFPVKLVRGQGTEVWDDHGKRYLDFLGGISVLCLGHAHPPLVQALTDQAAKLWHISNLYSNEPQEKLAATLVEHSCFDQAFFCNSGTEAVEAALKLARVTALNRGKEEKCTFIAMNRSFHGRSFGSLSVTGQESYQAPFRPLLPKVRFVDFGDLASLEGAMDETVAGVILEPLQAEGGLNAPPAGYLQGVRNLCDQSGAALIFDEVQVGIGRLGHLFAHQLYGVDPDIISLAKGLGGGFPIGAILAKKEFSENFVPGTHASTFGGNPLACATALAVLDELLRSGFFEDLRQNARKLEGLLKGLGHASIVKHRGAGMLQGLEFEVFAGPLASACLESGLLVGTAGQKVLRLAPPLNISPAHLEEGMGIIETCLKGL